MENQTRPQLSADISAILRKVADGKVVLFLGAGVNKGSTNSKGEDAPLGKDLAALIKGKFFPDEEIPMDLPTVCECVEARESRRVLDQFIYDLFMDYGPTGSALMHIPLLSWRRIYTTNFDCLLESAYEKVSEKRQRLRPIYGDRDKQDFDFGPEVPYVKLHGCVTRLSASYHGLILTSKDYASYTENRKRLFSRMQDDLWDHTILFMGYSLADANFHSLFYEVQGEMTLEDFPRCYAVAPNMSKPLVDVWYGRKVVVLDLTASGFFELARDVPAAPDTLQKARQAQIALLGERLSSEIDQTRATDFLKAFELVDDRLGHGKSNHENYYKGSGPSWSVIRHGVDAPRTYYDQIMEDLLLADETQKPQLIEVAVITAEAGAGKSTLLKRLAYDHACSFEGLCLFHRRYQEIPMEVLEELYRRRKKRIFIYMDDAADSIGTLVSAVQRARTLRLPVTFICAERKNEWNAVAYRFQSLVPIEYELPYLDDDEINNLLDMLERNDYLCALADRTIDERREIFRERADKQLLVAMREATEGEQFDRIIQNEFDDIPSELGRQTYLHICSLHRLGVPVRAGLLTRLAGVSFRDFEAKLLRPCERVIETDDDELGEHLYRARHPHIAEIVCRYALSNSERIASTYIDILGKMDLGYSSDLHTFRRLIRADQIVDMMPGISHQRLFYDKALALSGEDAYVHQQYGIMELRIGSLDEAETHLVKALQLDPRNHTIKHTYARLLIQKSKRSDSPAQQDRLFRDAQDLLKDLMLAMPANDYAYNSYAQNLIFKSENAEETVRHDYLQEAHEILLRGIRRCPSKSYLQTTDAMIFQKLGDYDKAKYALTLAHSNNPSNIRSALFLARLLIDSNEPQLALNVVLDTLKYNEYDELLNQFAAELLMRLSPHEHDRIIRLLTKAFDPEYIDYEPNFLLGVEYFRAERYGESDEIFLNFRYRKVFEAMKGAAYRVRQFLVNEEGDRKTFEGGVETVYGTNGFIKPDLIPKGIFFLKKQTIGGEAKRDTRVSFEIGFNLLGPIAQNIRVR